MYIYPHTDLELGKYDYSYTSLTLPARLATYHVNHLMLQRHPVLPILHLYKPLSLPLCITTKNKKALILFLQLSSYLSIVVFLQKHMKITMGKILRRCLNRWRKTRCEVIPCAARECCCQWGFWPSIQEGNSIPEDVPKGHLVVYVGENHRRFVIKVSLLKHPLFRALLDEARDEYDFRTDLKLCIPCNENLFLDVVRCASLPQERQMFLCL